MKVLTMRTLEQISQNWLMTKISMRVFLSGSYRFR